jgi:hypothetical protein
MSEPIITSSYLCHRCYRPDVEQIPQSDGQNDDDTLVPVGLDEHEDDGATITQVDSSVMFEPTPVKTRELGQHSADHHSGQKLTDCNKCGKCFTSKDHLINHMESCS